MSVKISFYFLLEKSNAKSNSEWSLLWAMQSFKSTHAWWLSSDLLQWTMRRLLSFPTILGVGPMDRWLIITDYTMMMIDDDVSTIITIMIWWHARGSTLQTGDYTFCLQMFLINDDVSTTIQYLAKIFAILSPLPVCLFSSCQSHISVKIFEAKKFRAQVGTFCTF